MWLIVNLGAFFATVLVLFSVKRVCFKENALPQQLQLLRVVVVLENRSGKSAKSCDECQTERKRKNIKINLDKASRNAR